jgi:hypothetical protein
MTILATDDCNRADAGTLGANWTNKRGGLGIFSNQVDVVTAADDCINFYSAISWPDDGYAQVVCALAAAANRSMMAGYRIQSPGGDGLRSGYYGGVDARNQGNNNLIIEKWNVSTPTVLASDAGTVLAASDIIKLGIVGSLITLYVNGVQKLQASDSLWTVGNAGLFLCNPVVDVGLVDDFEAGDAGSPPPPSNVIFTSRRISRAA